MKRAYENENKRIVSNKVIMEHTCVGRGNAWSHCRAFREAKVEKARVGVDKEIKNRESSRRTPRSHGAL